MFRIIESWLNQYKLKRKLQILYLACVLFPLIVTDSIILFSLARAEATEENYTLQNEAESVRYNLTSAFEYADDLASNIYTNKNLYGFLDAQYKNAYEYMDAYQEFQKASLFRANVGLANLHVNLYTDNATILNGGVFGKISRIEDTYWYKAFKESGKSNVFLVEYEEDDKSLGARRRVYLIKKMDLYKYNKTENIIKIELDYSSLIRRLEHVHNEREIYICQNDKILFSNAGHSNVNQRFETFKMADQVGYETDFSYYDFPMTIYILREPMHLSTFLMDHLLVVLALLAVNVMLPWVLSVIINNSLTRRMMRLVGAFENEQADHLNQVDDVTGNDEITLLMHRYNMMAERTNDLIQTVYKSTIREQEIEIARKNAELLALHSQINPHFMFNTLESIRMHSILRGEYETADMVEKLAVMERQIVNWNEDVIDLEKEMDFVSAYLSLQKYRFGDKLSYEIDMDEDCRKIRIPKLSIVTFVENACVHGIFKNKCRGWIFVRAYKEKGYLNLEIEDTGDGIDEEEADRLLNDMKNASMDLLKEKRRVGVINACLRLKMVMGEDVQFQMTSEKEIGTMINIKIPL